MLVRTLGTLSLAAAMALAPAALAAPPIRPNAAKTPGVIDPVVSDADICAKTWAEAPDGGAPVSSGSMTYSQAARNTSSAQKAQAFKRYGVKNPKDGGKSFEVDHRVPLSMGGRDHIDNLWPETRTAKNWSAWIKDRLENHIYRLLCHPARGADPLPLKDAQAAFLGDWIKAYKTYCPTWDACGGGGEE